MQRSANSNVEKVCVCVCVIYTCIKLCLPTYVVWMPEELHLETMSLLNLELCFLETALKSRCQESIPEALADCGPLANSLISTITILNTANGSHTISLNKISSLQSRRPEHLWEANEGRHEDRSHMRLSQNTKKKDETLIHNMASGERLPFTFLLDKRY